MQYVYANSQPNHYYLSASVDNNFNSLKNKEETSNSLTMVHRPWEQLEPLEAGL